MSKPENPPAFPSVCLNDPGHPSSVPGMTLRDWFAGHALPAVVRSTAAGQHHPVEFAKDEVTIVQAMAFDAYALADAMLAERQPACANCGARPVRDTLDGDPLCQTCCDKWARAEGAALAEEPTP